MDSRARPRVSDTRTGCRGGHSDNSTLYSFRRLPLISTGLALHPPLRLRRDERAQRGEGRAACRGVRSRDIRTWLVVGAADCSDMGSGLAQSESRESCGALRNRGLGYAAPSRYREGSRCHDGDSTWERNESSPCGTLSSDFVFSGASCVECCDAGSRNPQTVVVADGYCRDDLPGVIAAPSGVRSVSSFVVKRWPSEILSTSIAIASTDCEIC